MTSIVDRLRNDIDTNARHVAADYIEALEAKIAALIGGVAKEEASAPEAAPSAEPDLVVAEAVQSERAPVAETAGEPDRAEGAVQEGSE